MGKAVYPKKTQTQGQTPHRKSPSNPILEPSPLYLSDAAEKESYFEQRFVRRVADRLSVV